MYSITALVASSIIATVVRLFMYILGSKSSYLRAAIDEMGITVVVLEICIVMLRFLSVISIMKYISPVLSLQNELGSILFISLGMLTTYILTTLPKMIPFEHTSSNVALTYLSERPFEIGPVLVEYAALYLINKNIISPKAYVHLICTSVLCLIVAIHDTGYKNNQNLSSWLKGYVSPK